MLCCALFSVLKYSVVLYSVTVKAECVLTTDSDLSLKSELRSHSHSLPSILLHTYLSYLPQSPRSPKRTRTRTHALRAIWISAARVPAGLGPAHRYARALHSPHPDSRLMHLEQFLYVLFSYGLCDCLLWWIMLQALLHSHSSAVSQECCS